MSRRKVAIAVVGIVSAIVILVNSQSSFSQGLTIPDDCDNNLSSGQIATLVTMFASTPDGTPSYITCTDMMTDAVLMEFTEEYADFMSDPLNEPEDINDVNAEDLHPLESMAPSGIRIGSLLGKLSVGLMSPLAHTGHTESQHIERGDDGCPSGFDCSDEPSCFSNQYNCDDDDDWDTICKFSFANTVEDPDSARVWAEGSAILNARLRYYQDRDGGLNGFGPHSKKRYYICFGSESISRSQNYLHLRHEP